MIPLEVKQQYLKYRLYNDAITIRYVMNSNHNAEDRCCVLSSCQYEFGLENFEQLYAEALTLFRENAKQYGDAVIPQDSLSLFGIPDNEQNSESVWDYVNDYVDNMDFYKFDEHFGAQPEEYVNDDYVEKLRF